MSGAGGVPLLMVAGTVLTIVGATGSAAAALWERRSTCVRLAHLVMAASMTAMLFPTTTWALPVSVALIGVVSGAVAVSRPPIGSRACQVDLAAMAVISLVVVLVPPGRMRVGTVLVVAAAWAVSGSLLRRGAVVTGASRSRLGRPRVELLTVVVSAVAMSAMVAA